jgi:Zinc finger, C3HC4 type (RING finger)
LAKLTPSHDDNYLDYKIENKLIQNVCRQELSLSKRPKSLEWKDSGMSSCPDSSQEFLMTDGFLVRSSSSVSTQSFDSQNDFPASQASTQIQQDSDDDTDSEAILARVDEFTKERFGKMKHDMSPSSRSRPPPIDPRPDDFPIDVNDTNLGTCRFCMLNPKNGVFVHQNCLHLCCCYKCALKVWKKRKSCPICNCKIKNVTKLFVH